MAVRGALVVGVLLAAACHRPLRATDDSGAPVPAGLAGAPASGAGGAAGRAGSAGGTGTAGGRGDTDAGEIGGASGTGGEIGDASGTGGEIGGASGTGGVFGDGGPGVPCVSNDGRSRECAADLLCEIPAGACHNDASSPGICAAHPGGCDAGSQPVCGCDGRLYSNDCERLNAGVAKDLIYNCNPTDCPFFGSPGGHINCNHPGEICRYPSGSDCTLEWFCGPSNIWMQTVVCP